MDRNGKVDRTILQLFTVDAPNMIPYKLHPNNPAELEKSQMPHHTSLLHFDVSKFREIKCPKLYFQYSTDLIKSKSKVIHLL
jgi:hypothetical protein